MKFILHIIANLRLFATYFGNLDLKIILKVIKIRLQLHSFALFDYYRSLKSFLLKKFLIFLDFEFYTFFY